MIRPLGVAVLLLLPMAAFAQGNPGPFGGLFGRTPERVGRAYRLFEVRTVATGQLEDSLDDTAQTRQHSSWIGNGGLRAMFEQQSPRLDLQVWSHASYLQYFRQPYNGGTSVQSSATAAYRVATRLTLDAAVSHLYTPFFQFHPTFFSWRPDGVLVPPATPYVATAVASQSYSALGGLTIPYAKHSTLGAAFERRETLFPQRRDVDMSMSGMRGWWTRQVNRDLGIKLGYSRERAHLSGGDEYVYETFDAGINAVRPLSRDRRTTLSFRMETARVETPLFGRHYRLNGGVNLSSWVKRTWMFGARIDRATDFVAGFAEPLHSDTVGATLSGLLSRRAELQVQVDGGRGKFGFSSGVGHFAVGTGMTQFSYAVSRTIGVFVQHALFYYELPQSASLVAPVSYLARQTVTVGMTTWIPIYTRERSPSDTR